MPFKVQNEKTLLLSDSQVGKEVRVEVHYVDRRGNSETLRSEASSKVVNVNDAPLGGVYLNGTLQEDSILEADPDFADADGLGDYVFSWERSEDASNWTAISGQDQNYLALTQAEVGNYIRSKVSYTDVQGTFETVTSEKSVYKVANLDDAPTGGVSLSGEAVEDKVLVASYDTLADEDGLGALSLQWQFEAQNGVWTDLSGETDGQISLDDVHVGKSIRALASYTDGEGTYTEVASSGTRRVENLNDLPTGALKVDGNFEEGSILRVNTAEIQDDDGIFRSEEGLFVIDPFSYRWERSIDGEVWVEIDCCPCQGTSCNHVAYGVHYELKQLDVGHLLRVEASYVDLHGTSESVISSSTSLITNVNDGPEGSVVVTGTAVEDGTLSADVSGISDGDGLDGVFSYQWQRSSDGSSWNNISSATSSSYVLGDGDVGQQVRVQVAYTDLQGTREYVSSAASSAVANVNDAPTGGIVVEGTLSEGEELFANASSLGDADGLGSLSYRWERSADGQSWSEISDADAASYTLKLS